MKRNDFDDRWRQYHWAGSRGSKTRWIQLRKDLVNALGFPRRQQYFPSIESTCKSTAFGSWSMGHFVVSPRLSPASGAPPSV